MDFQSYNAKTLKEMVNDIPDYGINCFFVILDGNIIRLTKVLKDENILSKIILEVSELHSDYSCYIRLK
jgi:hypothetical protein